MNDYELFKTTYKSLLLIFHLVELGRKKMFIQTEAFEDQEPNILQSLHQGPAPYSNKPFHDVTM